MVKRSSVIWLIVFIGLWLLRDVSESKAFITISSRQLVERKVVIECCHNYTAWDACWNLNGITEDHRQGFNFSFESGIARMSEIPDDPSEASPEGRKCLTLKVFGNHHQIINISCSYKLPNSAPETSSVIRAELKGIYLSLNKTYINQTGNSSLISYECHVQGISTMDIVWVVEKEYLNNSNLEPEVIKVFHHINGFRKNLSNVIIFANSEQELMEMANVTFSCEHENGFCFTLLVSVSITEKYNPFNLKVQCQHRYQNNGIAVSNIDQTPFPENTTLVLVSSVPTVTPNGFIVHLYGFLLVLSCLVAI